MASPSDSSPFVDNPLILPVSDKGRQPEDNRAIASSSANNPGYRDKPRIDPEPDDPDELIQQAPNYEHDKSFNYQTVTRNSQYRGRLSTIDDEERVRDEEALSSLSHDLFDKGPRRIIDKPPRHLSRIGQRRSSSKQSNQGSAYMSDIPDIPEELVGDVDEEIWGKPGLFRKIPTPTAEQRTAYIGTMVAIWESKKYWGRELHYRFAQTFGHWNQVDWIWTPDATCTYLKNFLMDGGVYVHGDRNKLSESIFEVAQQEFKYWTNKQIKMHVANSSLFKSRINNEAVKGIVHPDKYIESPPTVKTALDKLVSEDGSVGSANQNGIGSANQNSVGITGQDNQHLTSHSDHQPTVQTLETVMEETIPDQQYTTTQMFNSVCNDGTTTKTNTCQDPSSLSTVGRATQANTERNRGPLQDTSGGHSVRHHGLGPQRGGLHGQRGGRGGSYSLIGGHGYGLPPHTTTGILRTSTEFKPDFGSVQPESPKKEHANINRERQNVNFALETTRNTDIPVNNTIDLNRTIPLNTATSNATGITQELSIALPQNANLQGINDEISQRDNGQYLNLNQLPSNPLPPKPPRNTPGMPEDFGGGRGGRDNNDSYERQAISMNKLITDFEKLYHGDDDNKYGGDFYDVLTEKLDIMETNCDQAVFDNVNNIIRVGNTKTPVTRKWGHAWMHVNKEDLTAQGFLTEIELRRLHRRFGHPSVMRLYKLLSRSGHDVEIKALEELTKVCHHCQMHSGAPQRFKFVIRDDLEFNYEIIVDVMFLEGNLPVLHVVDHATGFNAARFLKSQKVEHMWEALKMCWIDVYNGPPLRLITDAGKTMASKEFRANAKTMSIEVKIVPVEAHNSIGKVERYHGPLRRAYEIIRAGMRGVDKDACLQEAVSAINSVTGPNGLVPCLLVFGAYPRMSDESPPTPSIIERGKVIKKAMEELRKLHAKRQVSEALATRNGPNTLPTTSLPLNSQVRVWREKKGWTGPYMLISVTDQDCVVQMPHGTSTFRSTVVRPYNVDPDEDPIPPEEEDEDDPAPNAVRDDDGEFTPENIDDSAEPTPAPQKRGRGRPKGSRNKPKPVEVVEPDVAETNFAFFAENNDVANTDNYMFLTTEEMLRTLDDAEQGKLPENDDCVYALFPDDQTMTFLSAKEKADEALARELRAKGIITAPGEPFEASDATEVKGLIDRGVFRVVEYDSAIHDKERLFDIRMVHEVKGKATDKPFEKSRLVVCGHSDAQKFEILTQAPTIQRVSQRLIITFAPTLIRNKKNRMWLRDITQAYTNATSMLQRAIYVRIPKNLQYLFPPGCILLVVRPLYGIAEAGTHWWATYYTYHKEKLLMRTSTYDPCLLISDKHNPEFAIVGMQTDDTLGLSTAAFSELENEKITEMKFTAKPKEELTEEKPLMFNGGILTMKKDGSLSLTQKKQGDKLALINVKSETARDEYREQRARGAYIASVCQPEACFDLSVAAQHQDPTAEDMKALNKRLDWQMKSLNRGINYIPLDSSALKLFVFVDASFANNKDFTSQLGFAIVLGNETKASEDEFTLAGNLIHFSSTKCKRVTRSVLASEIYAMSAGMDMAYAVWTTIKTMTDHLGWPEVPLVMCTDSYSLYECLVKLGTTKEKRLMIDIMALRESYEQGEICEMRWIKGDDNMADAFTKVSPNNKLKEFIDNNEITVRLEGWVSR